MFRNNIYSIIYKKNFVLEFFLYVFLYLMMLVVIIPLVSIVIVSFSKTGTVNFNLSAFTMENWKYMFGLEYFDYFKNKYVYPYNNMILWFFNSIKIASLTAFLSVFLASLAGYAMSRFRFYLREQLLSTIFILQIFPSVMALVAFYYLLDFISGIFPSFGINTHAGLILVYMGGIPFHIWVLKGYFDTIPISLEHAARLDGLSYFKVYYKIVVPLSIPMLSVLFLIIFTSTFGDFLIPSVFLKDPEKFTFAVGMHSMLGFHFSENWGKFAAGSVFASVPIVILFMIINKYLVSGLTTGSVKG